MPVMPMPPQGRGLPEGEQPSWLRQLLVQLGAAPRTQREVGHQIAGSIQGVAGAVGKTPNFGRMLGGIRWNQLIEAAEAVRQVVSTKAAGAGRVVRGAAPAVKAAPQNMVRFYHGRGGRGGAGTTGDWWTTNPKRAASYGSQVSYVDVPAKEAEAYMKQARAAGSGTAGDALLPDQYIRQAQSAPEIRPTVYEIGLPKTPKVR